MLAKFKIAAEQAAINDFAAARQVIWHWRQMRYRPALSTGGDIIVGYGSPQDADISALVARLSDLETSNGPWQAMALEAGAGLALRSGNKNAAVTKYKRLMEMTDVPTGMRQRAENMIVMLGD